MIETILPMCIVPLKNIFCGCGDPEMSWQWVLEYLSAVESRGGYDHDEGAKQLCGYLLDSLGLTEHGGSIDHCWLTEDGAGVLAFLREWGADWEDRAFWVDETGAYHSDFSRLSQEDSAITSMQDDKDTAAALSRIQDRDS